MADPEYIELTPQMRERLEKFRDEHHGEPLGDVATRKLFEDDDLRIWEMRLEPGEWSDLHRHDHDYYLVVLEGDVVAGVPPKETGLDPFVAVLPPEGNTVAIRKGGVEWAVNVGDRTFREILIERKR